MGSPQGDARDQLRAAAAEQVTRWETALADQLAGLWARQEGVVLARLQGTKARRATRHWTPPGAKQLDPSYILDPARWLLEAINACRDLMVRLVRSTIEAALGRYGIHLPASPAPAPGVTPTMPGQGSQHGTDVPSPAAPPAPAPLVPDAVVQQVVDARLQSIGQAVVGASAEVQKAITDGEAAGEPMDQIADDVRKVYTTRKDEWTQGIVGTHVVGSLNESSLLAAQAAGIGRKQWLSSHDDRVRPSHRHADGQVVDIGDRFTLDTGTLAFPGDTTGPIGEWINCRCTMLFPMPQAGQAVYSPAMFATATGGAGTATP